TRMCFHNHNGGNWPSVVRIFLTIGAAMRALIAAQRRGMGSLTHPDWPARARARDGEITIRTNELLTHAHDVLVFLE
ncbi:9171_t:CDS:2, partial [Dentiscutata heterogama]